MTLSLRLYLPLLSFLVSDIVRRYWVWYLLQSHHLYLLGWDHFWYTDSGLFKSIPSCYWHRITRLLFNLVPTTKTVLIRHAEREILRWPDRDTSGQQERMTIGLTEQGLCCAQVLRTLIKGCCCVAHPVLTFPHCPSQPSMCMYVPDRPHLLQLCR